MAVTWQSQPNSARSTICRRRRLASGPSSQDAPVPPPQPLKLRPPATPYYSRVRRRSSGYRVASVDVVSLEEAASRRKSYALFSPYAPLPAIGGDAPEEHPQVHPEVDKKDSSVVMDSDESETDRPRYLRERTYSVIEPVLVRGPLVGPTLQWAQPVRPNNGAWTQQPERPLSPARSPVRHSPVRRYSPVRHSPVRHSPVRHSSVRQSPARHSSVHHSPVRHLPTHPPSPHLPNLIANHRRLSTPEMLDDVELPQDLDLDEDILSEDLGSSEIPRKRSDVTVHRPSPASTIDLTELPSATTTERRNSKLVTEVTDSLRRLWTRL